MRIIRSENPFKLKIGSRYNRITYLAMFCWLGLQGQQISSSISGDVVRVEYKSQVLDTTKGIWIYLPKDYNYSAKRYPVLYLFDGQNLFDDHNSYVGEWHVDETLETIKAELIVIGIEHGGKRRLDELTPWSHPEYGGGKADATLSFILDEIKPMIDSHYRTLQDRTNTAIDGSSLGGLMAFYSIIRHPAFFSKALVLSPSFWYSDNIYTIVGLVEDCTDCKIFMRTGTLEEEEMEVGLLKMENLLRNQNWDKAKLNCAMVPGEGHNEKFWAKVFEEGVQWLFEVEKP